MNRWHHMSMWSYSSLVNVMVSQIAKTLGSTPIRYLSNAKVSYRCLIDVDLRVFTIWVGALWAYFDYQNQCWPFVNGTSTINTKWFQWQNEFEMIWKKTQKYSQVSHSVGKNEFIISDPVIELWTLTTYVSITIKFIKLIIINVTDVV